MRILIIHQFYTSLSEPGIARFNMFAREWKKHGIETHVIASSINHNTGEKRGSSGLLYSIEHDESGVHIHRARCTSLGLGYWSFLGRLISYLSFTVSAFFTSLFVSKPDVIIASAPPIFLGVAGWLSARLRGVKFVFEARDLWPDEAIELGAIKNSLLINASYALERFIYNHADFIVGNSPGIKDLLMDKKGVSEGKVATIPNPVVPESRRVMSQSRAKAKYGWTGKFIVLYAGALSWVYDFDSLLESSKILAEKKDILFVIVGNGRQKTRVEHRVLNEGLRNVRTFSAVPASEVPDILSASDVCIATLKPMRFLKYIYATKLFSYMYAGKPVVLAMEGVSVDMLCDMARAGVCLAPGDVKGIASSIGELHLDSRERKQVGENGKRFVAEYADGGRLAMEYMKVFTKLRQYAMIPGGDT